MNALERLFHETKAGEIRSHATGFCPCHEDDREDGRRSLDIEIKRKLGHPSNTLFIFCRSCRSNGLDVASELGIKWGDLMKAASSSFIATPSKKQWPMVAPDQVLHAAKSLKANRARYRYLIEERLLSDEVVDDRLIGWDEKRNRYLLPIFDTATQYATDADNIDVQGCLWFPGEPFPDGTRKMCNWKGWPATVYPNFLEASRDDVVLLCEGEWDALCAASNDIVAISGTTGARHWNPAWNHHFEDAWVVVAYDCDEPGRKGAAQVAQSLEASGIVTAVLDLAPDRNDGYDITDYFRSGGTQEGLLRIMNKAFTKRGGVRPFIRRQTRLVY
jgi:hypothetical protein